MDYITKPSLMGPEKSSGVEELKQIMMGKIKALCSNFARSETEEGPISKSDSREKRKS